MDYEFTDFSDFDQDRGGETPTYKFNLAGRTLSVTTEGGGPYDPPDPPATAKEAVALLESRLQELKSEARLLERFLGHAALCEKYVAGEDESGEDESGEDESGEDESGEDE